MSTRWRLANDTEFGLCAGICTTSLKHASHFKRNIEAGMAMVNLPTAGVDYHAPFGGRKGSSLGAREQGRYAAEFYTTWSREPHMHLCLKKRLPSVYSRPWHAGGLAT